MALFSKLATALGRAPSRSISAIELPGGHLVSVVGESHRQPAIERTLKLAKRGVPSTALPSFLDDAHELRWFRALLIREPDNQHDANAIMVFSPAGHLGYLDRENAMRYQDVLIEIERQGAAAGACAAYTRRADNGMAGVVLVLSDPEGCLKELAQ